MLNVESDDFGEFTTRRCGCVFDELGLGHHFAYVRSFTKLTGEGATLLGTDCVRILEEVLPREFGGRSIDYQLLETEDERDAAIGSGLDEVLARHADRIRNVSHRAYRRVT